MIARLDGFKAEYATEEDDQFWLCIDKDHWAEPGHIANLRVVLQHCKQKGYRVAISNPCFELWLLLHIEEVDPAVPLTCVQIVTKLKAVCPAAITRKIAMGSGWTRRSSPTPCSAQVPRHGRIGDSRENAHARVSNHRRIAGQGGDWPDLSRSICKLVGLVSLDPPYPRPQPPTARR